MKFAGDRFTVDRCVVFGGGLKASPLQASCPISVLDLPLLPGSTVLAHVLERIAELRPQGAPPLPVTVVYGDPVPAPRLGELPDGLVVSVIPEPGRWRGPAGVLLDTCDDLPPDARILVLEGARWFGCSLREFVGDHFLREADVTIAQSPDRSPAGAYFMRRSVLDPVPRAGFLDLKEQLIARLLRDEHRQLFVHELKSPGAVSLRTLPEFLSAVRAAAEAPSDWSLVAPSATVDAEAVVVSSVVMPRARIGPGAVVARSIVLETAVVPAEAEIIDSVVPARRGAKPSAMGRAELGAIG